MDHRRRSTADNDEDAFKFPTVPNARRYCPYSKRMQMLAQMPPPRKASKASLVAHNRAIERAKLGVARGTSQCVQLLERNLQFIFRRDVAELFRQYRKEIIDPALSNLRLLDVTASHEKTDDDRTLNEIFRHLLDDAAQDYPIATLENPISISNEESSSSCDNAREAAKSERKKSGNSNSSASISDECRFVTGSMANSALGYSNARGRIYAKHPDLFRYQTDAEDKQWLVQHQAIKSVVGRVYLLRLADIEALLATSEYSRASGPSRKPLRPFALPDRLTEKVQSAYDIARQTGSSHAPVGGKSLRRSTNTPSSSSSEQASNDATTLDEARRDASMDISDNEAANSHRQRCPEIRIIPS